MKKLLFKITLISLALASAFTLASCTPRLKYQDGKYINTKTDIAYIAAPLNYEPAEAGDEYAKLDKDPVFAVKEQDPEKWLCLDIDTIPLLLCAEDIKLPSLTEFGADKLSVYATQNVSLLTGETSDKNIIDAYAKRLEEGENTVLPQTLSLARELKFSSPDYPNIYYTVMYAETDEGKCFFYDRGSKKCVVCTDLPELEFLRGPDVES